MPKHGWGDIFEKTVHNVYGKWNQKLDRAQFKEDAVSIDTYWNWGLASSFIKHSLRFSIQYHGLAAPDHVQYPWQL